MIYYYCLNYLKSQFRVKKRKKDLFVNKLEFCIAKHKVAYAFPKRT